MSAIKPIQEGEKVVAYPYLPTAAAWTYAMPRGTVVQRRVDAVVVELDDGSVRETDEQNLRRADGWRQPVSDARRTTKPKPLPEGWEQPEIELWKVP